jgi:hypothetical protein
MRRIVPGTTARWALIGFMAIVAASGVFLVSSDAFGGCTIKYQTECVETDDKGRCKRFVRVSYEECTEPRTPGGGVHETPGPRNCFECFEYNKDGSCRKTRKVSC